MSEPEYPYPKKPLEPAEGRTEAPPPMPPPTPPPPPSPPYSTPQKFTCQVCGKVFSTREELTLHIETLHQGPKKKT